MSKQRKIGIILGLMLPALTVVAVSIFWSSRLNLGPDEFEDAERFKSYMAVLPDVSYEQIEKKFQYGYRNLAVESDPNLGFDEDGNIIYVGDDLYYKEGDGDGTDVMEQEHVYISPIITADCKINDSYSKLSKELNTYLYQCAMLYANDLYVGNIHLSPFLPLSEANQEGGRVNTSVTFSAMASSSIFSFESVDDLANLNVTDCLRSRDIWRRMASEYYTRDRGALQCNPNYGANDPAYGRSEYDLLQEYVALNGTPDYGTLTDSLGNTYGVQQWIATSRTKYGDRFNVVSMLRMFADEKRNVEIPGILRNFPNVQNEWEVYCIMAYCHWCGSGYLTMDRSWAYAGWNSIERADEYCRDLSSPLAIEIIYSQCLQDIQYARERGRNPVKSLDKSSGRAVFDKLYEAGAVKEWDYYFRHKITGSWDQGATACTYPIGMIYGVMQMNLLYSGY